MRIPRKLKKKLKKHIAHFNSQKKVLNKAFWDEFIWGVSGIHVNKKTGEMKNVPINKVLDLLHNEQL